MMKGVFRRTVAVVGAAVLGSAAWLAVSAGPAAAVSYSPQVTLPFTPLNFPYAVAVDGSGDVYVADSFNSRVVELPAAPALTVAMGLPQTGVVGVPFSESLTALGGTRRTHGRWCPGRCRPGSR
jgi:NHL repeat